MATHTLPPATERWLEHYPVGAVVACGSVTLSEDELLAFAERYDPQPMHVDRAMAEAGPFGGLIASGWHTIGLMMPLFVEHYLPFNGMAAPGIEEVRWHRPVRPGDTLRPRVTVLESRVSQSRPEFGVVRCLVEVFNQKDELVLSLRPTNLIRRRPDPVVAQG
ncbi:MAG: hypothetical protein BGO51_25150 [Rhodospirillales bacterium 69-11]|nr:MAG: hypothetical protein BGO51_25150 [Rhodospirillales bacterium 69-11]